MMFIYPVADGLINLILTYLEMKKGKYNYSKRTAYTHISRGRDKFIKFLEEKDVLLWARLKSLSVKR